MVPLALLLWALAIGLVIFLEATSHLFGSYHRSKLKKRSFSGLLGILSWWWLAALSLRFVDALTGFIVPNLSTISLFQTLSFSALGVLGLVLTLASDLVLFVLIAVIYFVRQLALYLFVLLMPILIAFWIPGVGPFSLVSGFMRRMANFYVPFLFMTVPVALLFRLGELLGASVDLSMGGFGTWLTALVIPVLAVASPFVLFWQAGALFFMTDRAARHTSRARVHERATGVRARGASTAHASRNFDRGVRGESAVRPDGQALLGSDGSRAHRAGSHVRATGASLRGLARRGGGRGGGSGGGGNGGGGTAASDEPPADTGRTEDFENLRGRARAGSTSTERRAGDSTDDPIPYYQ